MLDTIEEYEKFKRERIAALERAGDRFSGVDERIDFLAPRILAALAEIRLVKSKLAELYQIIAGVGMKRREQIPFSQTLAVAGAAGSGIRLSEATVFTGFIKEVMIHWPPGCNALVDVMVGYELNQFCPREGWLALDAATPIYLFNEPVEIGRQIWVEMRNRDAINPHTITVTVTIEGA